MGRPAGATKLQRRAASSLTDIIMKKSFIIVLLIAMSWSLGAQTILQLGEDCSDVHQAIRTVREWRRLENVGKSTGVDMSKGVIIELPAGQFFLDEAVFLRPEDSGTAQSPTIIRGAANGQTVLSGGRVLPAKSWKKASRVPGLPAVAQSKVYVCPQPKVAGRYLSFRQLWVNGQKAVRARDVNDFDDMKRMLAWDKHQQVLTILTPKVKEFQTLDGVELVLHQMWAIANLRVASLTRNGDSTEVRFHQPESRIQAEHPWPCPMTVKGVESPYYMCNAIEFLDMPGEWYLDEDKHLLYYWPRKGEVMSKAEAIVPYLETLVDVQGSKESSVSHIRFENISFRHTTWMRPSEQGHVPLQAGMYLLDAYKLRPHGVPGNPNKGLENQAWLGRPAAAVRLQSVSHTAFDNCRFEHMASCAIDYVENTAYDSIRYCHFEDVGGNAIQAGRFSDIGTESHLPYDPKDTRELCTHLYIGDNILHDITNEDWGCVAICAGYVRNATIEYNEISEVSYSGISLGWGWQKALNCMRENVVKGNYIHHYAKHMYDVAGIYTLSAQPKTTIVENVVDSIYTPWYVHDPHHWFYLYTDEGSSFMMVKDNWCPAEKFLQNANGPGNTWENNGPMVSEEIKARAGQRKRQ